MASEDPQDQATSEDPLRGDQGGANGESEHPPEARDSNAEQLAEQQDRLLRMQAEMQNLRQRQARELTEERKYAALPVIRDLLPVLDDIDRALEAANQESTADALLEGFQLIRQQLQNVLDQHNCKPIDALGEVFDPNLHEAILQQPSAEQPAGTVMLVTQLGYQLHDRVVRPTQVIVSSGAPLPT